MLKGRQCLNIKLVKKLLVSHGGSLLIRKKVVSHGESEGRKRREVSNRIRKYLY